MDLINKDFVTANERVNTVFKFNKMSPLNRARIYMAAEKEALNRLKTNKSKANDTELDTKMISILCEWLSNYMNASSIFIGK